MTAAMIVAALELAAAGWAVFPCDWRPGAHEKAPLLPSPGFHLATTDPDQIKAWWTRWPKAMIGVRVLGTFIVIDVDPRNGGSLEALQELAGPLPATLTAWSGRGDGGRHLYFRRPAGELTGSRLKPLGIDLKANGYVIAPPSIHPATGEPYRWEYHPVASLPYTLRELLRPAPRPVRTFTSATKNGSGLIRTVAEAPERTRHDALVWAAFRARGDNILDEITEDLVAAAVAAGGETETSARRVIASVRRSS
jgi:Bifunctional DNA primase/polymerase, N-terminal